MALVVFLKKTVSKTMSNDDFVEKFVEEALEKGAEEGIISDEEKEQELGRKRTLSHELPHTLDVALIQQARGKFGSMESFDAEEELRMRVRDVLELEDGERLEKVLAEMKALYERLRDNTTFPGAIILEEIRSYHKDLEDALAE